MAIYSLNLGFISRSEGRSSVAFGAYISGSRLKDERTGDVSNYSSKENVALSRVLAPQGAPSWALNPQSLWNHVEAFEDARIALRFRDDHTDPQKAKVSGEARRALLSSAQTAQTIMGALPLEFSLEQAQGCTEDFLKRRFVSRGLVVHYAIHWEKGNPHFHGLVTRRALVDGEFSFRKDQEIVSRPHHLHTRKVWEEVANGHLMRAGLDVRIDCRSHKDRGSLFLPGVHEGYYAQRLFDQGEYSRIVAQNDAVRARNLEILWEHPEALIHEVSCARVVFSRRHLEDEIIRRVGGDEVLLGVLKTKIDGLNGESLGAFETFEDGSRSVARVLTSRILKNPDLISSIGQTLVREEGFVGVAYKGQEEKLLGLTDSLHLRSSKSLSLGYVEASLEARARELGFELSCEQQEAVRYLCSGPDIRLLNGRAGTGKTTLLKAVADAYSRGGYQVLGTSFQGKAAELMERDIGIPCRTLDSLRVSWERWDLQKKLLDSGRLWGRPYVHATQKLRELENSKLTPRHVIMVDEAGMTSGRLFEPLLEEAVRSGAKVILVGDKAQIGVRDPGDYGRLFLERYGAAETRDVVRQRISWQRECSALLNDGRITSGLKPYQDKGHIHWLEHKGEADRALVEAYLKDRTEHPNASSVVLAYRNAHVDSLNGLIRGELRKQGVLGEGFKAGCLEFAAGDRVRFTQNDHGGRLVLNVHETWAQKIKEYVRPSLSLGVKNGTLGTIIGKSSQFVTVSLDDGRRVKFNPDFYAHVTHGYALSVHKAQGSTFDRSFVRVDPLFDSSSLLVAMTRHRETVLAFASRDEIPDFKALAERVGRDRSKDTLADYQISKAQRPFFERVRHYKDILLSIFELREEMDREMDRGIDRKVDREGNSLFKHPAWGAYRALRTIQKEVASEILASWEDHAPFTRLSGLRRDVLEVAAGLRARTLSDLEHRASLSVEGYREVASDARILWNQMIRTHPGPLAQTHPGYQAYKALQLERNSLAALMVENMALYRPFLASRPERISTSVLKAQAQAHLDTSREQAYLSRLSPLEKEAHNLVQTYRTSKHEAALLYGLLKQDPDKLPQPKEALVHRFKAAQETRDQSALEVTLNPGAAPFLERLNINPDKLLERSTRGEIRMQAEAYLREKDAQTRMERARALQALIKSGNSSHQHLLKELGVQTSRLAFDCGEKIRSGKKNPETLYALISDYRKACTHVGKIFHKNPTQKQSPLLEEALSLRRDAARRLLSSGEGLSLFKDLFPEAPVERHAGWMQKPQKNHLQADHVLSVLKGRTKDLALELLGSPNPYMSSPSSLRFGKGGKISVCISGEREGFWYDFERGEGGNLFDLIRHQKNMTFKEAVAYASWFAGAGVDQPLPRGVRTSERGQREDIQHESRRETASHLMGQALGIQGTVAERYLREVRCIQGAIPQDLRFLEKGTPFTYGGETKTLTHPSLAAFGRDAEGNLSSVQLVKLNEDGTRATVRDGENLAKLQYGISKGSFVTLQYTPESKRVFIAEGVETALSVAEVGVQGTIIAACGIHNLRTYQGPETQIVLCGDNDSHKPESRTADILRATQTHFEERGKAVLILSPETPGHDFNDVLKMEGKKGVREILRPLETWGPQKQKEPNLDFVDLRQNLIHQEKGILTEEARGLLAQEKTKDFER